MIEETPIEQQPRKKRHRRPEPSTASITTVYKRKIWNHFVAAIFDYDLVKPGDKICVCISGGKDSMCMAKCWQVYANHMNRNIEVKFLVMNPGYSQPNIEMIKKNLETLQIPAEIVDTNIFEVANAQVKSPCYLCAKMRRGALYRLAMSMGCNKISLGHHFDDVIETTLMNMFNAGSFQTMLPKVHSDNYEGMELISPMYYIRERDIISWQNFNNLKFLQCACRFTEAYSDPIRARNAGKRLETKLLIRELEKENPNYPLNIFSAAQNVVSDKVLGWKDEKGHHSFLEWYDDFVMPGKKE
jgi:tRNA(Ile)-lysidine synthase TilS/MesJ